MTTEAAFIAYVAARRPRLFRTACLLCGDPHRAEDVVQDALVRLYAAWDRVARTDNIDGYVRRIIVNADYSDRRRPWRRERAAEPRDVPLDPGFPAEDAEAIRAALRALPPVQRRVIVLRHIWNLTIEETTEELDVLNRLVDYHDHITPPMVPVTDDVRRGRRRVRRNRGIATGAMALGLAGVVLAASVITAGDRDARPAPASPSPTPSPTTTKSQSPLTWADTSVAAQEGYGWKILDPLKTARDAWFPVVAEHLDPTGDHLQRLESSAFGVEFERPAEGSDYAADTASTSAYSTSGRIGLIVDTLQRDGVVQRRAVRRAGRRTRQDRPLGTAVRRVRGRRAGARDLR
jgi:RNA polymerase sigma factor (sigma-70 family)